MREFFDYLDNADPWAVLACVVALLWLLEIVSNHLERSRREYERFLDGLDMGIRLGRLGSIVKVAPTDIPPAFQKMRWP